MNRTATIGKWTDRPGDRRRWRDSLPDTGLLVFLLLLAGVIGALLYVGAKGRQETEEEAGRVVLHLWNIPKAGSHMLRERADRAVHDGFLRRYPEHGARSVTGIRLMGAAAESSFLLAMAGDTAPDIYESNFRSITTFMEQNFCFPLECLPSFVRWRDAVHHWEEPVTGRKVYTREEFDRLPADERDRFRPVDNYTHFYLPQVRLILCRTDSRRAADSEAEAPATLTYAFPRSYDVMGMYFNKQVFRQAGLNPEGPPADWTWEDFYRICQQLTVPEEGKVGFWLPTGQAMAGWMFPNFVWQAGGEVVREYYMHPRMGALVPRLNPATGEEDETLFDADLRAAIRAGTAVTRWRAAFDEKPGQEALKLYRRLMAQRWTRCREPDCVGRNTVYDLEDAWLEPGARHQCPVCGAEKRYEDLEAGRQIYVGCVTAEGGTQMGDELFRQQKCGMKLYIISDRAGTVTNPEEVGITGVPRGPALWRAPDGQVVYRHERETLRYAYTDPATGRRVDVDLATQPAKIFRGVDPRDGRLFEINLNAVEFQRLSVTALNADVMHLNNAIWYNVAGNRPPPLATDPEAVARLRPDEREALGRLDAAWRYLEYGVSREARALRTRIFVSGGFAAGVKPEDLEEFGYEEFIKTMSASWVHAVREMKTYGKPEPYAPGYKVVAIQDLASPIDKTFSACTATRNRPVAEFRRAVSDAFLAARLDETAALVNNVRFGTVPPEVARRRGWVANVVFAVALLGLAVFIRHFVRQIRHLVSAQGSYGSRAFTKRSQLMAWAFMLPALLSVLVWQYVPLVRGSIMAFQDYFILMPSRFVWLENFIKLMHDMDFRTAIVNTGFYVVLSLLMGFAVPIVLAVLLSEIPRGKVFFRVVFYLPNITSGLVITLMWMDFYNGTITGMLNRLLLAAGFISSDQPVRWLQDTTTLWGLLPMICVIIPGIWAGAGGGCLIYLAALKGVPDDVYEAADLDGAGPLRKFRRVTLPYIKPLVLINLVGAFIGSFHAAGNILLMTGGGPDNKTMTIGLQIFYNAYLYLRFGYATAMAWVLGATLIGFTLYQLRILKDVKFAANT